MSGKPGEEGEGQPREGPPRVSRAWRPEGTRVRVGRVELGGPGFVVMAGPCAVEGQEQTEQTAAAVAASGAHVLRGGVFKPRTSPYSFQGMGEPGLRVLAEAGRKVGLPIISEVMETAQLPLMAEHVDILQVGARNMQNFSLLRALGKVRKPVLLEVHPRPEQALCDGQQALTPERFQQLMRRLPGVLHAVDRHLWRPELPAQVAGAR